MLLDLSLLQENNRRFPVEGQGGRFKRQDRLSLLLRILRSIYKERCKALAQRIALYHLEATHFVILAHHTRRSIIVSTITLVGASGAIGKSVGDALHQEGTEYRVVGRDRDKLTAMFGSDPRAEIVTWNPDDPDSARAALRGSDTIVYLVGVPYHQFHLHPILMRKTVAAAASEAVERLVLIGTVYPYGIPRTTPVTEDHPREPHTFKGRMRKEQEDVLLEADAKGKIRGAILRLPDFYGPNVERSFLNDLFQAAATGRTANLIGPIDTPHEFIFTPDVGPVVIALGRNPDAWGRWWHLAGPGAVTQRELAGRVFQMAGRKPRLRVAGKNMLRLLGLFNPLMRELVEMHYLVTTPVLLDDSALQKLLGSVRKTSYEEGLRLSLDAAKRVNMDRAA
jgi:nucleoside-diphosphate-sugar epimerase